MLPLDMFTYDLLHMFLQISSYKYYEVPSLLCLLVVCILLFIYHHISVLPYDMEFYLLILLVLLYYCICICCCIVTSTQNVNTTRFLQSEFSYVNLRNITPQPRHSNDSVILRWVSYLINYSLFTLLNMILSFFILSRLNPKEGEFVLDLTIHQYKHLYK